VHHELGKVDVGIGHNDEAPPAAALLRQPGCDDRALMQEAQLAVKIRYG
jgi:hypothetical protein